MVAKTNSNQEASENARMSLFKKSLKNKYFGNLFTVNHFKAEMYPRANGFKYFSPKRKQGHGTKCQKMTKNKKTQVKKGLVLFTTAIK